MSQKCDICGKVPSVGRNVSHSHHKTSKTWGTNVHKMRLSSPGGNAKKANVCSKCLKAGKVSKA